MLDKDKSIKRANFGYERRIINKLLNIQLVTCGDAIDTGLVKVMAMSVMLSIGELFFIKGCHSSNTSSV